MLNKIIEKGNMRNRADETAVTCNELERLLCDAEVLIACIESGEVQVQTKDQVNAYRLLNEAMSVSNQVCSSIIWEKDGFPYDSYLERVRDLAEEVKSYH